MKAFAPTTLTTCAGRHIDLLSPTAADIDFAVIAEHLAKNNRYCGATPGTMYSVADHSVRAGFAALTETGDSTLAAYLLCHDMHEAYLGDDTTPKKRALAAICQSFGTLAGVVEQAFSEMTHRLDLAIHNAAGLPWPPTPEMQTKIKHYDRVMLATEWRDLMHCSPPYDFEVPVLQGKIEPRGWQHMKLLFMRACDAWLPACRKIDDPEVATQLQSLS